MSASSSPPAKPRLSQRLDGVLLTILGVSLALRVILAIRGGAEYYPDEGRFNAAISAVESLRAGDTDNFFRLIFSTADHLGYKASMTLPAWCLLQWHWNLATMAVLSSGIFSTANIGWIYALARRTGAGRAEARWSALLMAASCSMFYWSRHLMPYDYALFLGLACLYVSLHPAPRWHHSLTAGVLGFCTFVTYNGSWSLVAFILTAHVLRTWPWWRRWRQFLLRSGCALAGLVLPFLGLVYWAAGRQFFLLDSYIGFSNSIFQGDFGDAHRFILEYLWAAEKGLLLVWLGCLAWFVAVGAWRPASGRGRAVLWLSGLLTLVAVFIGFCDVEHKFVVYGRLVRQIVPFACLLGGWVLAHWRVAEARQGRLQAALAAAIVVIGGWNLAQPLRQRWDFHREALQVRDRYLQQPENRDVALNRIVFLNEGYIWPEPLKYNLPPYQVLLSRPHIMQFRALLYEGYNREQREKILATDITMRVVVLDRSP
ncbi:MAG TPA: hypothetical protein VG838_12000 [Opitutaceae bacterium]|nr:hypothetical protein [Opitutaceae bacterium]